VTGSTTTAATVATPSEVAAEAVERSAKPKAEAEAEMKGEHYADFAAVTVAQAAMFAMHDMALAAGACARPRRMAARIVTAAVILLGGSAYVSSLLRPTPPTLLSRRTMPKTAT
jgi:hypothetical protein